MWAREFPVRHQFLPPKDHKLFLPLCSEAFNNEDGQLEHDLPHILSSRKTQFDFRSRSESYSRMWRDDTSECNKSTCLLHTCNPILIPVDIAQVTEISERSPAQNLIASAFVVTEQIYTISQPQTAMQTSSAGLIYPQEVA